MTTSKGGSWFERYSWTVFVFFSAILVLFGATDLPVASTSTSRENAINELFIGLLSGAIVVMGLRLRKRWAWYAMALWPVWIGAQAVRAASAGKTDEMWTAVFLRVFALAALALSFRPAFREPQT